MTNQPDPHRLEPFPGCRLWLQEGLFYAEVRHPAAATPLRVALHGISTYQEANQAAVLLAGGEVAQTAVAGC